MTSGSINYIFFVSGEKSQAQLKPVQVIHLIQIMSNPKFISCCKQSIFNNINQFSSPEEFYQTLSVLMSCSFQSFWAKVASLQGAG